MFEQKHIAKAIPWLKDEHIDLVEEILQLSEYYCGKANGTATRAVDPACMEMWTATPQVSMGYQMEEFLRRLRAAHKKWRAEHPGDRSD